MRRILPFLFAFFLLSSCATYTIADGYSRIALPDSDTVPAETRKRSINPEDDTDTQNAAEPLTADNSADEPSPVSESNEAVAETEENESLKETAAPEDMLKEEPSPSAADFFQMTGIFSETEQKAAEILTGSTGRTEGIAFSPDSETDKEMNAFTESDEKPAISAFIEGIASEERAAAVISGDMLAAEDSHDDQKREAEITTGFTLLFLPLGYDVLSDSDLDAVYSSLSHLTPDSVVLTGSEENRNKASERSGFKEERLEWGTVLYKTSVYESNGESAKLLTEGAGDVEILPLSLADVAKENPGITDSALLEEVIDKAIAMDDEEQIAAISLSEPITLSQFFFPSSMIFNAADWHNAYDALKPRTGNDSADYLFSKGLAVSECTLFPVQGLGQAVLAVYALP